MFEDKQKGGALRAVKSFTYTTEDVIYARGVWIVTILANVFRPLKKKKIIQNSECII